MPVSGDSYSVVLKGPHLGWGEVRHTGTRPITSRETYIPIPAKDAYRIGTLRGKLFNCTTSDKQFTGVLRASGNQSNPEYAKQFHTDGNLQVLADWLIDVCNAQIGDIITVTWLSASDIELSHTAA